jgi:transposase
MPKGTLANWASAAKCSNDPGAAPGSRSVAELEAEVAKLRKELAVERTEKEVLEKATAYFARESLPGMRVHEVGAARRLSDGVSRKPIIPNWGKLGSP